MKVINVHSHIVPSCFWNANEKEGNWYGASLFDRDGIQYIDAMNRVAGPIDEKWRLHPRGAHCLYGQPRESMSTSCQWRPT